MKLSVFPHREFCPELGALRASADATVRGMNEKNPARGAMKTRQLGGHFSPKLEKAPETSRLAFPTIHQNIDSETREQCCSQLGAGRSRFSGILRHQLTIP